MIHGIVFLQHALCMLMCSVGDNFLCRFLFSFINYQSDVQAHGFLEQVQGFSRVYVWDEDC